MIRNTRAACVLMGSVVCSACILSGARAGVLLSYSFDETGNAALAGGAAATGGSPTLDFIGNGGGVADLHGAPGSGVSSQIGDRSFNNVGSSGLFGSRAANAADFDPIDGLTAFTLSGWFFVPSGSAEAIGRQAPLFENGTISVLDPEAGFRLRAGAVADAGTLELRVNRDQSVESARAYAEIGQWVNFAVSYDGAASTNNVQFYKGLVHQRVQLVTSATLDAGPADNENVPLVVGGTVLSGLTFASFSGQLDNLRIYDEVASLATLESARLADAGVVPEPSSLALGTLAAMAVGFLARGRTSASATRSGSRPTIRRAGSRN